MAVTESTETFVGSSVKRKEDAALVRGNASWVDNLSLTGMVAMAIVRSPYPHARIRGVNLDAARGAEGVIAAFSGADLADDWAGGMPCAWPVTEDIKMPTHFPLAIDEARYQGDGVAVVLAETRALAKDAAELVEVDYEPLDAIADVQKALDEGAPVVHDDLGTNECYVWKLETDDFQAALDAADVVVTRRYYQPRLIPNAIEPRGVVARAEPDGDVTLWSATQIPHILRFTMPLVLGIPESKVRVIAPDVGGGFGSKLDVYAEDYLAIALAKRLGRPVKWIEERAENYVATIHGRDVATELTFGATRDGKITAVKGEMTCAMGAYLQLVTPGIPLLGAIRYAVGGWDSATIRFQPLGSVQVVTGTSPHGQSHETTWAQIAADRLGVSVEDVEVLHGDTAVSQLGMDTYGSRSLTVGGIALWHAAEKIVDKARQIVAHQLEVAEDDLEFENGSFSVKGSPDRAMGIKEVAFAAHAAHNLPDGLEPGLEATAVFDPPNFSWPAGAHAAVVEIDIETGDTRLVRYVAVDDVGNPVNPMIIDGQVHGGITQGISAALYEEGAYDDEGNLLSTTMTTYLVPSAAELPSFETDRTATEAENPLGVKGVGETGTIAAAPAVINAVVDALFHLGVTDIQMPATPERVWRAIEEARA
jgi:CO/xanthine dehydrogenase Mo-binding subunit